ncbi:subtype A tannase [Konateibacter massiliensis]|uniref:subtype A tannase n=1 Tax=Konateibacter massiliensis TaxID=2002841 RepID=UPI000C14FB03|nr:subtype A tannase [Konateibacter massiliensis]
MKRFKRTVALALITAMTATSLSACGSTDASETGTTTKETTSNAEAEQTAATEETGTNSIDLSLLSDYKQDNAALTIDNSKWNYDSDNDVYWQIGVVYCATPETTDYETMGIYVPGAYMTATDNGDGTYTCVANTEGSVQGYTAETAPIVFPVNTAGYSAQAAPTSYSYDSISEYLEAGFVYVYAGMRGRDNGYDDSNNLTYSGGAPWGVTDLKAAVRYYRYNQGTLPGDTDSIFTFGHSGGGAQSTLMGATGDSSLYYEYLTSIGAAMFDEDNNYVSDAINGAMAWCPITSLDYADEAYEWNMGQFATTNTRAEDTWTSALSEDLANAFAVYLNALGLTDENGTVLTLEESEDGAYLSGTYYDYMVSEVERSLNNFLSDTTFPYTPSSSFMNDGGFGGAGGGMPEGGMPEGGFPEGEMPEGAMPEGGAGEGKMMGNGGEQSSEESTTYETVQDYIDSLNAEEEWIEYDASTNTAKISSLAAFATYCKTATKSVGAFDDLERSQAENNLFGNDESDSLHFDSVLANLLETNADEYAQYSDWDSSIAEAYSNDLQAIDKLGSTIEERLNMYNPMYYLSSYYDGYGTSTVASHWRIRTGIEQGDTALTVETNLALALEQYDGVEDVDFETVWAQGHTTAERTGDSSTNFIEWVNECVAE